jgi:hypothetical protein
LIRKTNFTSSGSTRRHAVKLADVGVRNRSWLCTRPVTPRKFG